MSALLYNVFLACQFDDVHILACITGTMYMYMYMSGKTPPLIMSSVCYWLTFSGFERFSKIDVMREAIPLGKRAEMNSRMFLTARSCDGVESCTALAILKRIIILM